MALTDRQESNLISKGDCFEHWHSEDRVLTHDDVLTLQGLAKATVVIGDITVDSRQDYLLVDTSVLSITVTLPRANQGREIEIMKNATANYLRILTSGTDKIFGLSEVRVYNYGTSLRFKAIPNGWFII